MLYVRMVPIADVGEQVLSILSDRYGLENMNLSNSLSILGKYLEVLRPDLHVLIEHPYVDKYYRDTYYHYFATKNSSYAKNSIRLSFFAQAFEEEDFREASKYVELKENYRGFLSVRPTFPKVIGRSVLDPRACSGDPFVMCRMPFDPTANGLKFQVDGFPHCSQDGEATTCAETTLWSILEYFGNKYSEYAPALPSQVTQVLNRFSFERLLPSQGLRADQIAYSLKESGFGVKIYARSKYPDSFDRLVRIYVESGIPVVGILRSAQVAHALSIVGRRSPSPSDFGQIPSRNLENGLHLKEFADLDVGYVFVDDNHPPYRISPLNGHFKHYNGDPRWAGCELTEIIVPLNKRIYLEAGRARVQAISLIESFASSFTNKHLLIRTFLMSSRSFKHEIGLNPTMHTDAKELLMQSPMPKFIWVTEVSDMALMAKGEANGLIVMDATEPRSTNVIGALLGAHYISLDLTTSKKIPVTLQPFTILQNNLH